MGGRGGRRGPNGWEGGTRRGPNGSRSLQKGRPPLPLLRSLPATMTVTQVQLRRNHLLPDSASEISHFIGENNQRNKKGQKVNEVKQ